MPVVRPRRLVAALLVVAALGGLALLGSVRSGGNDDRADHGRVAVSAPVADHGLPALRRNDRQDHGPLALALLALVAALAVATPRPTPIPVPVVDDARHRWIAGRLPRRRGPPPRG